MEDEKLNIFDVLNQINNKNYHYLDTLPVALRNQFNPYVVYQWLTCTDNAEQLTLIAHYVNENVLTLSNHPELLYKLFCTTSCDRRTRYNWLYKKKTSSLAVKVISEYFRCSYNNAKMHLPNFSSKDIATMAKKLGYQDVDLKKLL